MSYYILEASGASLFILMKKMISISENLESFRCWTLPTLHQAELAALVLRGIPRHMVVPPSEQYRRVHAATKWCIHESFNSPSFKQIKTPNRCGSCATSLLGSTGRLTLVIPPSTFFFRGEMGNAALPGWATGTTNNSTHFQLGCGKRIRGCSPVRRLLSASHSQHQWPG